MTERVATEPKLCGAVCADDPMAEHPCVNSPLHRTSHKDSRGWTWAVSNEELAASPELSPAERAHAAARAEYWRAMVNDDWQCDDR